MRNLMILLVGVCLLFALVPAMADQAEDEAAIRKVVEQLYAVMNKYDVKGYTALCAENFEETLEDWTSIKGHAAMEEFLSNAWVGQKGQIKFLDEIDIVWVTPDVAIHKGRDELKGYLGADGKAVPPSKRLSARVLVKKSGEWLQAVHITTLIQE